MSEESGSAVLFPADEALNLMMTDLEKREKGKLDQLAKMQALAELDRCIIRVSLHVRGRHQSPSQFVHRAWRNVRTCRGGSKS